MVHNHKKYEEALIMNRKITKKLLAVLLASIFCLAALPFTAFAGTGAWVSGKVYVYMGPSDNGTYPTIGWVQNEQVNGVFALQGTDWSYISYNVDGTTREKGGFIRTANLSQKPAQTLSFGNKTMRSKVAQNVVSWIGNNSFPVGSIGSQETVTALAGVNNGQNWYIIQYNVDGTNQKKIGFVPMNTLEDISQNTQQGPSSSPVAFSQMDSRWATVPYGYSDTAKRNPTNIGAGGCGLLALTNAVYAVTNHSVFLQPADLASLSVSVGARVNGVGTNEDGLARAAAQHYGSFHYNGIASRSGAISWMRNGGVCIVGISSSSDSGHLMAAVAVSSDGSQVLVLDSYPSSSRGTTANGTAWIDVSRLSSTYYLIGR